MQVVGTKMLVLVESQVISIPFAMHLHDLQESLVEALVVPGVQDGFAAGFNADGAIAVEFE